MMTTSEVTRRLAISRLVAGLFMGTIRAFAERTHYDRAQEVAYWPKAKFDATNNVMAWLVDEHDAAQELVLSHSGPRYG